MDPGFHRGGRAELLDQLLNLSPVVIAGLVPAIGLGVDARYGARASWLKSVAL